MSKKKTKPQLVEKVAEETKVPASDLDRLPVESLEKLDALVPDAVVEEAPKEEEVATPKRLVGYHPVTKEPVFK